MRPILAIFLTACATAPAVDSERLEGVITDVAAALPACLASRTDPSALAECRSRLVEASINVLIDEHEEGLPDGPD